MGAFFIDPEHSLGNARASARVEGGIIKGENMALDATLRARFTGTRINNE
jgi:hypothetical protein